MKWILFWEVAELLKPEPCQQDKKLKYKPLLLLPLRTKSNRDKLVNTNNLSRQNDVLY